MTNLSRKVEEIGQTRQKNQVSTITDIKYTDQDPMMERQKILIAHNQDAKLVYLREQADNALENGKQIIEKNIQITIIDDILQAKHRNDKHYKPILPQNMIKQELKYTHQLLGCSSSKEQTVNEIRKFYNHYSVTYNIGLDLLSRLYLPCKLCRFNSTISMKRGVSAYGHTRNIAANIAGHTCSVIAHNILYIQMKSTRTIPKPYISLFACYGCGTVDVQSQSSTSGNLIAGLLLDFMVLVGIPPHLVISDSASTDIKGKVKQLIGNCNIPFNKLNKEKIKQHEKKCTIIEQENSQTSNQEEEGYLGHAVTKLTTRQREILLKEIRINSDPPLHRPIITHSPTPYLGVHPQSSTSDFLGSRLGRKRIHIFYWRSLFFLG